jgi:tetratricopeptide (TPR) repeat protein/DNA-binding CsgD family transcriptional regulator
MLFDIAAAQEDNPTPPLSNTYNLMAEVLFKQGLFSESLLYYKLALETFTISKKSDRNTNVTYPPWILINIGNVYFHNKNFDKAFEYYEMARNAFSSSPGHNSIYGLPTAYDNIGKVFFNKANKDSAKVYFDKSLKIRQSNYLYGASIYSYNNLMSMVAPDDEILVLKYKNLVDGFFNEIFADRNNPEGQINIETNYGTFYYMLGLFYYNLSDYETSIPYLIKSRNFLNNSFSDLITTDCLLAKSYIGLKNFNQAETLLQKNLSFLKEIGVNSPAIKIKVYEILDNLYLSQSKKDQLLSVKDSIINLKASISDNKLNNSILSLETSLLLKEKQKEINDQRLNYYYLIFGLIISLLLFFGFFISLRVRFKFQKEKNNRLALEREFIDTELKNKELELLSTVTYIEQRDNNLRNLRDNLNLAANNDSNKSKGYEFSTPKLTKELDSIIKPRSSFDSFKNQFSKAFPDFYKTLLNLHPNLSPTDLRLCAYIKMNQNNQDIAGINNISTRTVESQRYRLRMKLNIDKQTDLFNYLTNLD